MPTPPRTIARGRKKSSPRACKHGGCVVQQREEDSRLLFQRRLHIIEAIAYQVTTTTILHTQHITNI
jgi:hypothetical protein